MRYELIIFDWDGTLSNSAGVIVKSIEIACQKLKIPIPKKKNMRSIIGLGLDEAFLKLFEQLSDLERMELKDLFRRTYFLLIDEVVLFDGVETGIKMLYQQGFKLAIATGTSRKGLDNALRKTKMSKFFSETKTIDECFSKPHPQMINEILSKFFIDKEKALMVGDSGYDLQMASNAGIDSIAVSYGSQELNDLKIFNTKAILHNSHDLFDWIRLNG